MSTDPSPPLGDITEFNELLYDEIIPRLFRQLYELDESQQTEEYKVDLIKLPLNGYYEVLAAKDKIVRMHDAQINGAERARSFHLDTYCFDSGSQTGFSGICCASSASRISTSPGC